MADPIAAPPQGSTLAVIGLGVMGRGLACNLADRGFGVAAFDLDADARRRLAGERHGGITVVDDLGAALAAIASPRRLLLMVPAGPAVDRLLEALAPQLGPGDVVIDGGNSFWRDTARRQAALSGRGVGLIGLGVSGGETGARHGPALMAGGEETAWARVAPLLEAIAAEFGGEPCCARVGGGAAGHFVKMLHNGIEYAEMQAIAEAYHLLSRIGGRPAPAIGRLFAAWAEGPLAGFLVETTAAVLARRDEAAGLPLVDLVLDVAEEKGTGRWASLAAVELGVPAPSLLAAVAARGLSALKEERVVAESAYGDLGLAAGEPPNGLSEDLEGALLVSRAAHFAQGMAVIAAASREHGWAVAPGTVARVWRGGCIIRCRLLDDIVPALAEQPDLANLLLAPAVHELVSARHGALRRVAALAAGRGIPLPVLSAGLAYLDSYRAARLPANLLQAQRDAFGAHGFRRIDRPGAQHVDWLDGRG